VIIINIQLRIQKLRTLMEKEGIDAYIVPSSDPHQSEYVAEHYAARTFISGFTGSAGTVVITLKEAGLWTDGRYFVQAESQLKDTGVSLFRVGESGVPSIEEFLKETLKNGSKIGFDGKVISVDYFRKLKETLLNKGFIYEVKNDLINKIWENRPSVPTTQVITHDIKYTGKSREEKLGQAILHMKLMGATHYVISGLDDIAWLLNIRGKDIKYNPLTIAYIVLSEDICYLFIDERKLGKEVRLELEKAHVEIRPYESINTFLDDLSEGVVLFDPLKTNIWLHSSIKVKTLESLDITTMLKAIKNETEIQNVRNAMVSDGIAMVKFINWIKKTIKTRHITEIEASQKLESFRIMNELFYDSSFSTISAYKANASMPHYHATEQNQATIKPESFYLVDSGAQYLNGTTDITRTIVMGNLTEEEKTDYTLVLKGMISLSMQRFVYGTTGSNLDVIARIPLWNAGMDYKHGTGHGIGFFLNVHEGPYKISTVPNTVKLEKGMIISNEPGLYKPKKHGIRIENLVVVREDQKTQYGGQFMKFETLTLCPIDLEAIDVSLLTKEEKNWLNEYHQIVFNKLSPYLDEFDVDYLKQATKEI
jgi:Xaa-Pro aminopeptidase